MQNPIKIMAQQMAATSGRDPHGIYEPSGLALWRHYTDDAKCAIAALEAAGLRLAPPVATEEMLDASETMFRMSRTAEPAYSAMHGAMKTWGEG